MRLDAIANELDVRLQRDVAGPTLPDEVESILPTPDIRSPRR
jgi:hypothetical protein